MVRVRDVHILSNVIRTKISFFFFLRKSLFVLFSIRVKPLFSSAFVYFRSFKLREPSAQTIQFNLHSRIAFPQPVRPNNLRGHFPSCVSSVGALNTFIDKLSFEFCVSWTRRKQRADITVAETYVLISRKTSFRATLGGFPVKDYLPRSRGAVHPFVRARDLET